MKKFRLLFILFFLFTLYFVPDSVFAASINPQYIFVRKDPMGCNPSDCRYLWNLENPDSINAEAFRDITDKLGRGSDTRRIGIGVMINIWEGTPIKQKESLLKILALSKSLDVPVLIAMEAQGWWDNKPNLWNWWDATRPGYNPDNINNVEWTCWNPQCATKKAWRNWGSEFETKPQPNLASPLVISEAISDISPLLQVVSNWYNNELGPNQKYLLGGVTTANEIDMGTNYYYYPNGISNGQSLVGSVQLGFNAVKTITGRSSGTITAAEVDLVIKRYQTALNKTALEAGIPRSKIYNHNGGKGLAYFIAYPLGVNFQSISNSVNEYAQPGWSMYGDVTNNPQNYPDLMVALNRISDASLNNEWSSPEWFPSANSRETWITALRNTLNFRNNRFLNVANWESIRDQSHVIEAIKTVANEGVACWVASPGNINIATSGNSATLTWENGNNNSSLYLNVSNRLEFLEKGLLREVNVANAAVTSQNSYIFSNLLPGTYYWTLIADGCVNQRRIVGGRFQITASPITATISPTTTLTSTVPVPSVSNNLIDESMRNFWQGNTVYNESVLPISTNGALAEGSFMFPPISIISVKNSALNRTYTQGTDWILVNGKLRLPAGSSIPSITQIEANTPRDTTPLDFFAKQQLAVTYTHGSTWSGPVPAYAGSAKLPNTTDKLSKGESLKIVLYGDSISVGYNMSGLNVPGYPSFPPYLMPWGQLVANSLQKKYLSPITFINSSEATRTSTWGVQNVQARVGAHSPDLVILAFGMNDGINMPPTITPIDPGTFQNNLRNMMTSIRSVNPKAEFILVSTTLMHPAYQGSTQSTYINSIMTLQSTGVVVANMTGVHQKLLQSKKFSEITGNNVNHPNDFLGRWYAQMVAGLLLPPNNVTTNLHTSTGDVNSTNFVDQTDFNLIKADFGTRYNIFDYNVLVKNFNTSTLATTPTPTSTTTISPSITTRITQAPTSTLTQTITPSVRASLTPTSTPTPTPTAAIPSQFSYGVLGDIPVVGNWSGGRVETQAVVRGKNWLLKNTFFGPNSDVNILIDYTPPARAYYLACDWNGDGKKTPGVVSNGVWNIRNSNTSGVPELVFNFGLTTDIPVCGDWNGDGTQTIGIYREGKWFLRNSNSDGFAEISFEFGNPSDTPITGHWTGTRQDLPGLYRSSNSTFYLKNSHTSGFADSTFVFGNPGDTPIVGDWAGLGRSSVGVVRGNTWYLKR